MYHVCCGGTPLEIIKFNFAGFFFWSYPKNIVYENEPTTRLDMMNRIKRVCEGITPEILRKL